MACGTRPAASAAAWRSEEHTSELQSLTNLVCRLLLEKKKRIEHVQRHAALDFPDHPAFVTRMLRPLTGHAHHPILSAHHRTVLGDHKNSVVKHSDVAS